uniref:RING-type domain-containing protein n=1 Tax=Caenorhabditis japonica TaxID=281687 RepID=A0A8R1HJI3_CAEJA
MSHVTCHIVTLSHCHLSHCQLSLVKLSIVTSQNGYCQKNPGLEGKLPIIVDFITFESIIDIFRVDYQHDRHGDNRSRAESRKSTVSIIEVESTDRANQVEADREFAIQLQRELLESPTVSDVESRVGANMAARQRNRAGRSGNSRSSGPATDSAGGGPIRRNQQGASSARRGAATRTLRRGTATGAARCRPQRTATRNADRVEFNGDRVQVRRNGEIVDVTANAYFPDSDNDSDYETPAEQPRSRGRARGRGSARGTARGAARGRGGSTRPAVNGNFIRMLLEGAMRRDDPVNDPDVDVSDIDGGNGSSEFSDLSDLSEMSDDDDDLIRDEDEDEPLAGEYRVRRIIMHVSDSDEGTIDLGDSEVSGNENSDEEGNIVRDANHIDQPIFHEDQQMYDRELNLYHDEDEYRVRPDQMPKVPMVRGKPVEPDSTWGDCTMCSNPPIKPQGCNKCLQILGCQHCVKRWYAARQHSNDGPSCPLCRTPWGVRPKVMAMHFIDKKRRKNDDPSQPSTSSSASTSRSAS